MRKIDCYVIFETESKKVLDFVLEEELSYRMKTLQKETKVSSLSEQVFKGYLSKVFVFELQTNLWQKFLKMKLLSCFDLEISHFVEEKDSLETEFFTVLRRGDRLLLHFDVLADKFFIGQISLLVEKFLGTVFEVELGPFYHVKKEGEEKSFNIGERAEEIYEKEKLLSLNKN